MPGLDLSDMQRCACGNLRKTTRRITQFYDRVLQPTGLRSTQCSMLCTIVQHENLSLGELGTLLLMDQTTVTRNIAILRKDGYVVRTKEEKDARKKTFTITERGLKKLAEALPLWKQAQSQVEQGLGSERFQDFLKILRAIEEVLD